MLLECGEHLHCVSSQISALRIGCFFRVHLYGLRVSRNHLLNIAMIEGWTFEALERSNHLVVGGIDALWNHEIVLTDDHA